MSIPPPPRRVWTLQRRLILTVTGIVSLIVVLIGVATSALLGGVLEGRLDERVRASQEQMSGWVSLSLQRDPTATASDLLAQVRADPGFLLAVRVGPLVSGAVYSGDEVVPLTTSQLDQLDRALGQEPRTVTIDGVGSYQVSGRGSAAFATVVGYSREDIATTIGRMLTMISLLTAGGLVLLAGATAWTIRTGLTPLRAVAATAGRVSRQRLDQGEVRISERVPAEMADPRTEVGQVGAALNALLDHVDQSLEARQRNEERMRRFVADASHELRTPLASIRGYSELSLRAMVHAPEQAAETSAQSLERIQAQSLRMTRIVEDLLLLARLDEGQELMHASLDVTRLMVEAVGDARAAGPEHRWVLDVPEAPLPIVGDAGRLQQVLANLLANARLHTPAGTVVTGSVQREGDEAILRVHDDGPGIDPAMLPELFERFARADRSRARQTGGSGLGLSIAQAIVQAHGGSITVASVPGDTTFTVRLPFVPRPGPGR